MAHGTDKLSPSDAATAVRSFPRRFRAILASADDDERFDPDEIGRRVGPDGRSAVDHLLGAEGVLAVVDGALEQVRRDADPVLPPAVGELDRAEWTDDHSPVPSLLDQLEATADRLARRMDDLTSHDWSRRARVADGHGTRSVLAIAQDAVGVAAAHLRAARRTIDAVR